MNIAKVFNPNPPLRTGDQWKEILRSLVRELEDHLGVAARTTDFTTQDDKPGSASRDNGVEVVFDTQAQLGYELCGVVRCRVKVGKEVRVHGDFLAFTRGIRVPQHGHQCLVYVYDPKSQEQNKWACSGWMPDDAGKWASTKDSSRWRKT